jgi:hypothetical protein
VKPKPLQVHYATKKLTLKIVKNREFAVVYENAKSNRTPVYLHKHYDVFYSRDQTKLEQEDALKSNREFTVYSSYIDKKKWNGDWDSVANNNFLADENNVHVKERLIIKNKLLETSKNYLTHEEKYKNNA